MRVAKLIIFCILISCLLAPNLLAERSTSKWAAHLKTGWRQPVFNPLHQPWVISWEYDAEVYHRVNETISLGLMLSYAKVYNDSVSTSKVKIGTEFANRYWRNTTFGVACKFYINADCEFCPYLKLGAGLSSWEIASVESGKPLIVKDSDGADTDYSASELFLVAGIGAESFVHPRLCIDYSLEVFYLPGLGADFDDQTHDYHSHGFVSVNIGLGYYFGPRGKSLWEKWRDREEDRKERKTPDRFIEREPDGGQPGDTIRQGVDDLYADTDYDGVRDEIDLCPDTPLEASGHVDETGCPTDGDADGVPDYRDECFNTPLDMAVDSSGCPLDDDSDGVPNRDDRCPDTPRGYDVDRHGCVNKTELFAKRVLHFDYPSGGSNLTKRAAIFLDSLTQLLNDFEDVTIKIYGYTDNIGDEDANLRLSQKRADKLKGYLVLQGIAKERIVAMGMGETNFIASNANRFGREKNRRIEVEFRF